MQFVLTKIIDAANKVYEKASKDFLKKFALAIKSFYRHDFKATLELIKSVESEMSSEDKYAPFNSKTFSEIKVIFNAFNSTRSIASASTFEGGNIIDLLNELGEMVKSSQPKTSAKDTAVKTDLQKTKDFFISGAASEDTEPEVKTHTERKEHNAAVPNDINVIKKELQKTINKVIELLNLNLNDRTNPENFNAQLQAIKYEIRDYDQMERKIKEFKKHIDDVLNPDSEYCRNFNRLYKRAYELTTANKANKVEVEMVLRNPLLNSLLYNKISYDLKPNDVIQFDKNNFNLGGKDVNLLALMMLYLKAHYYWEIKKHMFNKLEQNHLTISETSRIKKYIFGSATDSFDPTNVFKFKMLDPRLLNENVNRSKIKKSIAGFKSIKQIITADEAYLIQLMNDKVIEINTAHDFRQQGIPLGKIGIAAAVIFGILAFGSIFKKCGCAGGSGGDGEDGRGNEQADIIENVPGEEFKKAPPIEEKSNYNPGKRGPKGKQGKHGTGKGTGKGTGDGDKDNGLPLFDDGSFNPNLRPDTKK